MNRLLIILSTILALLSSCSGRQQGEAVPSREGFDITGVWMMIGIIDSTGIEKYLDLDQYTRCKIYDTDNQYCCVHLRTNGKFVWVKLHELGDYHLNDTLYEENGRITPFCIIDDSTMTTKWTDYTEIWRRSATITESRKAEILDLARYEQNAEGSPLRDYVLSTSERELKHTISTYHYLFIILLLIIVIVVLYAVGLAKRKRRAEANLAAIKEELNLRPAVITDAIKQVEDDFFQSDYYTALRIRIAEGSNMTDEDWREMERQVNAMSSGFTRKLRSLYDFSDIEYQVCLLIKLRIPHKDIAAITHRAPDSVSSIRSRLHKKILGPNGGAKEWDYFVLSL